MWIVITPTERITFPVIERLLTRGAIHLALSTSSESASKLDLSGKQELISRVFNPSILKLRNSWAQQDNIFAVGWSAIPLLLLIKFGWLRKPKYLVSMGCFVHNKNVRWIINKLLRMTRFDGLRFVAFSRGELDNLVTKVGVPPTSVFLHLWRQELNGRVNQCDIRDGEYIFSGGYSNRDYGLLISVLKKLGIPAIIVASKLNKIPDIAGTDIKLYYDLPEEEFERLLAGARLVVLPLKETGEACGQSVLLRTLRNHKPLIITRHEAVEEYLGGDYPGFVKAADAADLKLTIQMAYAEDRVFMNLLSAWIKRSHDRISAAPHPGDEVYEFISTLD